MKFIEASADIPGELIHAVNDGNVVFLCGAGVSRGVGLPSFRKLTDDVYTALGESQANEAAERIAYDRKEYDRCFGRSKSAPSFPERTRVSASQSRTS